MEVSDMFSLVADRAEDNTARLRRCAQAYRHIAEGYADPRRARLASDIAGLLDGAVARMLEIAENVGEVAKISEALEALEGP